MLKESFHNHTWRCRHADGTEREYVENAISAGMTKLGFSDHTPYAFTGVDYYSGFRMRPEQLEDYVKTVLDLKKEYAREIEIHLGLETEYYPRFFEDYLRLIEPYPIEYIIMGQHFLNNELDQDGSGRPDPSEERLMRYVSQTGEGMKTGKFAYIAHPDIFYFTGDRDVYAREMRKLCENAKNANVPLEINLLGIRTNRSYPNEAFWKIAGEVGNDVVCGGDAHAAKDVCDDASFERALEWVKRFGLKWHEASYVLKGGCRL